MRKLGVLGLVLLALVMSAAPAALAQRPGGTVTVIHQDVSVGLNPVTELGYPHILRLVYNGLVDYGPYPDHKIVPGLAESWQVSSDSRVFTFKLRRGVKWQDGTDLTSADVAFTYSKLTDPQSGSPYASLLPAVERIDTPDAATAIIRLKDPSASFLAWTWVGVMPKHVWEKEDFKTSAYNQKPVGSGPFKLVSWAKGDSMVFEANPGYFRGRPHIDRVILKVIPDPNVAFSALERGELDAFVFRGLVGGVPWPTIERMRKNAAFAVHEIPVSSVQSLHFNMENQYFRNLKVRQALSHAVDRQAIINNILFGKGEIIDNPVAPPTFPAFYNPNVPSLRLRPGQGQPAPGRGRVSARGERRPILVRHLRHPRGAGQDERDHPGELPGGGGRDDPRELRVGDLLRADADHTRAGQAWALLDPERLQGAGSGRQPWLRLRQERQQAGGRNYSEYVNPKVDELLEQGRREADPAKRAALYKDVQVILAEDLPMFPLYLSKGVDIWKSNIKGMSVGQFGGGTLGALERAWIEPAR